MAAAQQETEKIYGFDDVDYADDSNFIQMNLPCLRLFANFYIFEGRDYGLEVNADTSFLVVIRPAPVMLARLRHPDAWFFQIKVACKTLGLTYGNGFDTAKILINDRIGQVYDLMDQYKRVWKSPIAKMPLHERCRLESWPMELAPLTSQKSSKGFTTWRAGFDVAPYSRNPPSIN